MSKGCFLPISLMIATSEPLVQHLINPLVVAFEASTKPEAKLDESYPEGSLTAWMSALGSFSGMVCGFGLLY